MEGGKPLRLEVLVLQDYVAYRKTVDFLEANLPQLLEMHPNQWVAASDEAIVGINKDFGVLRAILDETGIDMNRTVMRFLKPPTLTP